MSVLKITIKKIDLDDNVKNNKGKFLVGAVLQYPRKNVPAVAAQHIVERATLDQEFPDNTPAAKNLLYREEVDGSGGVELTLTRVRKAGALSKFVAAFLGGIPNVDGFPVATGVPGILARAGITSLSESLKSDQIDVIASGAINIDASTVGDQPVRLVASKNISLDNEDIGDDDKIYDIGDESDDYSDPNVISKGDPVGTVHLFVTTA